MNMSLAQRLGEMIRGKLFKTSVNQKRHHHKSKAILEYFVVVSVRNAIKINSVVSWLNAKQLLFTLNDGFFLLNLI